MGPPPGHAGGRLPPSEGVALALVLLGALWVRLPMLSLAYDADEVGTAAVTGFTEIFLDPETGVNPPLWRWMWCVVFSPWDAVGLGRVFSFACSLLAVALGWLAGRRASGAWFGGLAVALLLAFHPWLVRYAVSFRAYAFWSAAALAHLLVLGKAVVLGEGRNVRAWRAATALSAILLPWIHYFSVPLLLGFGAVLLGGGAGRRRDVLLYLPAAVGTMPLWPFVFFRHERRADPGLGSMEEVLIRLGSLGLEVPGPLWRRFVAGSGEVRSELLLPGGLMGFSLGLVAVVMALGWRRLPPLARLAWAGQVSLLLGALLFSRYQYVRSSALVMMVTIAPVALVGSARLVPSRAREVWCVLLLVWCGASLPGRFAFEAERWNAGAAFPVVSTEWRTWDVRRAGRPFFVSPSYELHTLFFHLAHRVPGEELRGPPCAGWGSCFARDGVAWVGVDEVGDGAELDGLLVIVDPNLPADAASACERIVGGPGWGVWDCPGKPPGP